ncbi:DUF2158 domain-containing protein [uncultured Sulfitobacter sp.]|uniref:YodC family protein n=1 Tax=uncultured Sulfitobacter sp. TaxID=191468 RepID=UPI00259755CB|nr:DUF2158 domain-containing protein [uncultured Sulfitobacter sp.]
MSKFAAGDKVQLNSGGPIMTVEEIENTDVQCVWFQGKSPNQAVMRDQFSEAILTHYSPGFGGTVV